MKVKDIVQWFKKNRYAFLVILIAIIVRLPLMTMMQRWDSGEYYWRFSQAVKECTFSSFTEYMELFTLCNHPTMVFCLLYILGELLFPEQIIGASVTSLILTVIALWCIYRIIGRCCEGITEKNAALSMLIISFAPLFLGTTAYFNPDYALAIFFIIALWAYLYKKPVIAGLASLACFQTKETGLVLIFGLVVGTFVRHIAEGGGFLKIVKCLAKDVCLYTTLAATCVQLYYMKYIGGVSNWVQTGEDTPGIKWDSSGNNCLGFNLTYIGTKLKQQFVLNFNWIFTLLIIIGIIYILVRRRKSGDGYGFNGYIYCLTCSLAAFVIFSCMYITAPMARYNVAGDLLLLMTATCVVHVCVGDVSGRQTRLTVAVVQILVSVLLAVECVVTIDPLTIVGFRMLNTGSSIMCYTGETSLPVSEIYYGDYLVYNTQYTYIDRAYDYILKKTGYDGSWNIIIPTSNGNFINGNMYGLNWDMSKRKRVFYENKNTVEMNGYILVSELAKNYDEASDTALLIINPYYIGFSRQAALEETLKYYNCTGEGEYSSLQGKIYYYVLEKKTTE